MLQYVLDDSPVIEAWQRHTPGNAQCQAAGGEAPTQSPVPARGENIPNTALSSFTAEASLFAGSLSIYLSDNGQEFGNAES